MFRRRGEYISLKLFYFHVFGSRISKDREQVWSSGKALACLAEGPRFDTASALLSLQKGCGLWTLSCGFVHHFLLKH